MKYIISVDQSTSGTKAALYDERLEPVRVLRREHKQYYPAPGHVEHDAEEIWLNTAALLNETAKGIEPADIAGIGLANQRETTVIWEKKTGKPVHNAIVWQDVRAKHITDKLKEQSKSIFNITGLMPSPYYSAAKAAAVLQSNPHLMKRAENGELCFGTVDSYLLYRLTGGESFATDVTNASRTQLMDLNSLSWSEEIAGYFSVPLAMLPERIMHSDSCFGRIKTIDSLRGAKILAMLGDSHASLFGHGCIRPGMVKTSYGTGSSLMMNIGAKPMLSKNGLSTSVGFAFGGQLCYVLEGNVTSSADTLIWLRDGMQLISSMKELDLASTVSNTEGVYLVPAFSGLGAPWFDENAKAILYGMNRGTGKAHIIRAALASIAHQNADVLDAMRRDTGIEISRIQADGGGSVNPILMQMQSDLVPCQVIVSAEKELTLLGAAAMVGSRAGLFALSDYSMPVAGSYSPAMSEENRKAERFAWLDALYRCR